MSREATFRVHFEDGTKLNVPADSAAQAKTDALKQHRGVVTKIKIVREKD